MSARGLTALLAVATLAGWGLWIALSGIERNLALAGWMPFSRSSSEGSEIWLLLPIGIFVTVTVLAWVTEDRWLAWVIPLIPVIGFLLFWVRYLHGMSHFG